MQIVTQISRKKIHKVLILGLLKVLIRKTKTSHSDDRNRTSSLFGLFPSLLEESVEASPLRRRAASSPTYPFKVHGRGEPPSKPSPKGSRMKKPLCDRDFQTESTVANETQ